MNTTAKLIIAGTGLVMVAVIQGLAWIGTSAQRRHLLNHGHRVTGTVVAVDNGGSDLAPRWTVHYRFTPPGRTQPIEQKQRIFRGLPSLKAGDEVMVCVHPRPPFSSLLLSPQGTPL